MSQICASALANGGYAAAPRSLPWRLTLATAALPHLPRRALSRCVETLQSCACLLHAAESVPAKSGAAVRPCVYVWRGRLSPCLIYSPGMASTRTSSRTSAPRCSTRNVPCCSLLATRTATGSSCVATSTRVRTTRGWSASAIPSETIRPWQRCSTSGQERKPSGRAWAARGPVPRTAVKTSPSSTPSESPATDRVGRERRYRCTSLHHESAPLRPDLPRSGCRTRRAHATSSPCSPIAVGAIGGSVLAHGRSLEASSWTRPSSPLCDRSPSRRQRPDTKSGLGRSQSLKPHLERSFAAVWLGDADVESLASRMDDGRDDPAVGSHALHDNRRP